MTTRGTMRSVAREWFCALCCYSLLIAPFGCQLVSGTTGDGGWLGSSTDLGTSSAGLFISDDPTSPVLLAGRDQTGNAFYVYGERDEQGNLGEINSIVVQAVDGSESFVTFESGRPVHIEGADGSYVHISYEELSTSRLAGTVEVYDAATGVKQSHPIEIDLQQTAAQIAERVGELTGRDLKTTTAQAFEDVKTAERALRITIFSPLYAAFVVPFVAAIGLMTVILGQVLVYLVETVMLAVEAVLLAIFAPLFLIAEMLNEVIVRVEFIPLFDVFVSLPDPPLVVLF